MQSRNTENDGLDLGLERFISLSRKNPALLGEIIQKRLDLGVEKIYKERKAAGLSVTYRDDEYPGLLIREDSNGKRFIIDIDVKNDCKEVIIREIPSRKKAV